MYAQYRSEYLDYSFFDAETVSFTLTEKASLKFESKFNKSLKEGKTIEDSIVASGGDLSLGGVGFITVLRKENALSEVVDFVASENNKYVIIEKFESFSSNYDKHALLEDLIIDEASARHFAYQLSEQFKELNKKSSDFEQQIRASLSTNYDKKVEKKLKSLKGKQLKDIDSEREKIKAKFEEKDQQERTVLMGKRDEVELEWQLRMKDYYHKALMESFGAKLVSVDLFYESYDESNLIKE